MIPEIASADVLLLGTNIGLFVAGIIGLTIALMVPKLTIVGGKWAIKELSRLVKGRV